MKKIIKILQIAFYFMKTASKYRIIFNFKYCARDMLPPQELLDLFLPFVWPVEKKNKFAVTPRDAIRKLVAQTSENYFFASIIKLKICYVSGRQVSGS